MQKSKPIMKRTSKKAMCYGFEKIRTFIITVVLSYRCNEALSYLFNDVLLYSLIDEEVCCCDEVSVYKYDDVQICRFAYLHICCRQSMLFQCNRETHS